MADIPTLSIDKVWHKNTPPNVLIESPIYRHSDSTLHWVDIHSKPCTVHILPIDRETNTPITPARILSLPPDITITVLRFRENVKGSYICGTSKGIALLDEETGEVEALKTLVSEGKDGEEVTMNDGEIDPQGRFWIGEVDLHALQAKLAGKEEPEDGWMARGRLWRVDRDGRCEVMETGIMCGNGMVWSPDGRYMYFNDSGPQIVWRYDFDGETGNISNRIKFIEGFPEGVLNDGMVIDRDGNLWIAMWMESCLMVYSPDGKPIKKILLPAKCPTCPAWGGKYNNILFVGSAKPLIGEAPDGDEGGHLFCVETDTMGISERKFSCERRRGGSY